MKTLRPIQVCHVDQGRPFEAWFHGWTSNMWALVEMEDGSLQGLDTSRYTIKFLDRAAEFREKQKAQEEAEAGSEEVT